MIDKNRLACEAQGVPLFVLALRKPRWNGCVERANGTTRYEFYRFYEGALSIAAVHQKLDTYQDYYNYYRPHHGIGLETSMSSPTTHAGRLKSLIGTEPGQYFEKSAEMSDNRVRQTSG